ncbi:beta-arrestin-1 isoform X4 [Cherax quadricarinatus]|uniref:beta-arrestin-1 isoform X4 n=1 Tax=Cherax quadricarinatus TaxID=27406 RepID=UPI00387EC237
MDDNSKRQGTRVFKKSSPNGKITVYLGKRDFVDHITHVDPIDGVVLIDPEYLKDRKVFGHVLSAFRYGREDLDVLGLTFRKDLYLASEQIFPLDPANKRPLTRLQERLIKKLGPNAFPFFFELPPHCPASVTLQPAPGDMGKPCGVDYELKAYVGDSVDDKPHKRNSVRLAIRKVMYAPMKQGDQPSVEVSKEFMMSPNKLHLEASLDKELYYHGETVAVNVHIQNNSNKSVKKIKVSVRQFADICLFSTAQYKCTVAETESDITDSCQKENLGIIVQYKVKVKLILGPLVGDLVAELPFTLMHPKPEEEPESNKTTAPATSSPTQDSESTPPVDANLIELDTSASKGTASLELSLPVGVDGFFRIQSLLDPVKAKLEQLVDRLRAGSARTENTHTPVIKNPHAPGSMPHTSIPSRPNIPEAGCMIVDLINLNKQEDDFIRDGTTCYADQDDDIIFEDFARLRLKGETEA